MKSTALWNVQLSHESKDIDDFWLKIKGEVMKWTTSEHKIEKKKVEKSVLLEKKNQEFIRARRMGHLYWPQIKRTNKQNIFFSDKKKKIMYP